MTRKMWTGLAMAIAAGSITAGGVVIGQQGGGPPPAGTANLWIDTNGGTCTRSATAVAYVDAAACSTMQAASSAATSGDTIRFVTATFSAHQTLTTGTKTLTFEGELATIPGLTVNAQNVTVKNLILSRTGATEFGATLECENGCANVVFDNFDIDNNDISSGLALGFWAAGSGITFQNSEIHDIIDNKGIEVGGSNGNYINNDFYDILVVGPDVHNECIYHNGASNVVYRGNKFYNCPTFDILFTTLGGQYSNITIENNVFGTSRNSAGGAHSNGLTWQDQVLTQMINFRIVHNTWTQPIGGSTIPGTYSGNVIANNLGPKPCWPSGTTYSHNVGDSACGPTDVSASTSSISACWANPSLSVENLHLLACSPARNQGDPAYATGNTANDRDGVARDSTPDAGAYEFVP